MIGKLEIVKTLGQQSKRKFGKVVLLVDKQTNRHFVLKTTEKCQISERALDQLRNEAAFSFQLEQLPTVAYHEETENSISILLEYKNGIPLDEFWKSVSKRDRLIFTKTLVSKLLTVLDHIHQHQVFHCDLKPSNILIEGTIDSFKLHLIDFGLAIKKEEFIERKLIFPLGFAAPELLLNRLHLIDQTTDYFAMAIMVYYLWSGELPLSHANPSIFTNLQLAHPIQDHPSIPRELNNWVQKICVKPKWLTSLNLLPTEKVDEYLKLAMEERFQSSHVIIEQLNTIKERKWSLFK